MRAAGANHHTSWQGAVKGPTAVFPTKIQKISYHNTLINQVNRILYPFFGLGYEPGATPCSPSPPDAAREARRTAVNTPPVDEISHRRTAMFEKLGLIALAGAAGTLARYWLSGLVYDVAGQDFPWGTAAVNILGCFLFGLFWELGEDRMLLRTESRVVILTGFMGAFTTFSTFVFESNAFLEDGRILPALANVSFQTVTGFAAMFAGLWLGRQL